MKKLAFLGLAALVFFGCERRDNAQNTQTPPANGQVKQQNGANGSDGANVLRNGNSVNGTKTNGNGGQ
ncbi:MAG: hypothetical protein KDK62_00510 [Chlamydiia bacterium]|nr:hypothetical protein [Chlamydiia bacterium]